METATVLMPAERPASRRGVARTARIVVSDDAVELRLPRKTHRWPLGADGVASAVHVRNACVLAEARARQGGQHYYNTLWANQVEDAGGCLHLCDAEGRSLVCLLVNDWVPNGSAPVTLKLAGKPPGRSALKPAEYLRLSGFTDALDRRGVPVSTSANPPEPADGGAGSVRPGPYERRTLAQVLLMLGIFLPTVAGPVTGLLVAKAQDRPGPLVVGCMVFAVALLLLWFVESCFPTLRGWLAPSPGGPTAVLRPSPGVPVRRGTAQRSRVAVYPNGELLVRDERGAERWLRGPADPVTGVQRAVRLTAAGSPWALALLDRRDTVLALLPWETWFGADPELEWLSAFLTAAGIPLEDESKRVPRPDAFHDTTGLLWAEDEKKEKVGGDLAIFGPFACALLLTAWKLGDGPLLAVAAAAVVVNLGGGGLRLAARKLWWDAAVAPASAAPSPQRKAVPNG